jgi:acyl-CoA synthetase (NDP forming)
MTTDVRRMDAFFRPASIAVVGAGERATSSGGAVLRNLRLCGWAGRVIPVNPKGGVIQGLPAVTSLREISPPADLVAVLVRPEAILDVAREAAATGHRNLLILPGGFSEAGEAGRARDAELRALAASEDLLIGGPNCGGLVNVLDSGARFAATFFRDVPAGGPVALISQSGAIAEEMIAASHRDGIPLGAIVSVGNAMHLDLADYVDYLGADPQCGAILLYVESFGYADRFREVAARVSRVKPIVALVGGRTEAGRHAAFRHTGSLAMTAEETDAFCSAAGVLRVASLRELRLAGKVFGTHPAGIGRRVLVLSNSGGPGVLAADAVVQAGLQLVDLPADLAATLRGMLPPEAAVANPMDLLADAREDRFAPVLATMLDGLRGHVDAVLMIHVVPFMVDAAPVVTALAAVAASADVPILHTMMGTLEGRADWFATLASAGVPAFGDAEEMCVAAGMLARRRHPLAGLASVGSERRVT